MNRWIALMLALIFTQSATAFEAVTLETDAKSDFWGTVDTIKEQGWATLSLKKPEKTIELPTPIPNVTSATMGTWQWPRTEHPILEFNADASKATLVLPDAFVGQEDVPVTLRFAEESNQFPNGRIVLSALDAEVVGKTAKLETHPGNHRIGFWSNDEDYVQWNYKATRPAKYRVQLTYSLAGDADSAGSTVEVSMRDGHFRTKLRPTSSWYRYTTVDLGEIYLPKPIEYTIDVKCIEKQGGAVMNLKAVTLVPTCEGSVPSQADDGTILLHSKDVTANGILLQWEPRDIKRTLGYWANANDYAYWDFVVDHGGSFDIQILQGCGKGHGGSVVNFDFYKNGNDERNARLTHTVVDTGHWQAFEPKEIGTVELLKPGKHRLRVSAVSKAKGAVMDLRQVLLTPNGE